MPPKAARHHARGRKNDQDGRRSLPRPLHLSRRGRDGRGVRPADGRSFVVRKPRASGARPPVGAWEFEVGEDARAEHGGERDVRRPSSSNPIFTRKDRPLGVAHTNLPYPKPAYSVTVDAEARSLVVRTANKSPDLDRGPRRTARMPQSRRRCPRTHENNTLVIQYKKPADPPAREGGEDRAPLRARRRAGAADGQEGAAQQ